MAYTNFCISAGHAPAGGIGCGAVGYHDESKQARLITTEVVNYINGTGSKAYDCTCTVNCTQQTCLDKIIAAHNKHTEKHLDVSIHLNCFKKEDVDGKTKGIEVLVYSESGDTEKIDAAKRIMDKFKEAGFTVRGLKINPKLRFLKETKMPAILVECYFCDDKDDTNLADNLGEKELARMITEGLIDKDIKEGFEVNPADTIVAKCDLRIRSTYKANYKTLGVINKGTEMVVSQVRGNRAKINGSGLWVKCTEKCVKVKR